MLYLKNYLNILDYIKNEYPIIKNVIVITRNITEFGLLATILTSTKLNARQKLLRIS